MLAQRAPLLSVRPMAGCPLRITAVMSLTAFTASATATAVMASDTTMATTRMGALSQNSGVTVTVRATLTRQ